MSIDRSVVRQQLRFVNEKLNDWDFIGVADSDSDKYECLTGPLTRMLRDGEDEDEIATYIHGEVRDHFGMGEVVPRARVATIVADLVRVGEFAQRLSVASSTA